MTSPRKRQDSVGVAPPAADWLIAADGVGVKRAGRWLIHDVDLEARRGEIVTLIGPNGGGKTTLVRVLLNLIAPDAGSVRRKAGLSVGYVPQQVQIDAVLPLTVHRLMTVTARHSRDQVAAALRETGIEQLIDRPVQVLSGGEFQRVLLARAVLRKPDLLILDEPVQGVDYAGEAALYQLISEIRDRLGCGILMISHDLHVVMAATDRVLCLNHHVCCTGAPADVTQDAEYRRLFGPRAVEAYALYQHAHDHDHDLAGEVMPVAPEAEGSEQSRRDA